MFKTFIKSLLLEQSSWQESVIVLSILFGGILITVLIAVGINNLEKRSYKKSTRRDPNKINLKLREEYIDKREFAFLNLLFQTLPEEFVAFPNVGLANIVAPNGDKVAYNRVYSEFVDVCIFQKDTMRPLLAIDLYKVESVHAAFRKMSDFAIRSLKSVGIKVLVVDISKIKTVSELRREIIAHMPDSVISDFRQKLTK